MMGSYTSYFLMKAPDAAAYARQCLSFFTPADDLEASEIGDGNLNYIFRVQDRASGRALVIKQAGDTARISDEFKVSTDRSRIEHDALQIQNELAPGLVARTYKYDPVMKCTALEDLSDHVIMRNALLARRVFPRFADDIATFLARTLFLTSDLAMDHKRKKELAGRFINPDLCEITEDLVYTEPFNDLRNRNAVFPPNRDFVARELYQDAEILRETAKLKFSFLTSAQSLVHGDLHTGSIFVREDSTKVIDPEFAFYGPAGYDLGNVIANLLFAWVNAHVSRQTDARTDLFLPWLESTIEDVVSLFARKWQALFEERATEPVARYEGFGAWYLEQLLADAAGVTGLELCRRIVGLAKVRDITGIADPPTRVRAERACLLAAKRFIIDRHRISTGREYLAVVRDFAREQERT
jgi:5-methylthioribose kinase